jgi:HEAT repeat protein
MSSNSPPSRGLSPDEALPPVEPPNAGFILQLFIVPGVIVVVVVMIWVMFSWLAQKGNDSEAFVRALGRNNEARWQAAFNLANALRGERNSTDAPLKNDSKLAAQLAEILDSEIEAGNLDNNSLTLRIYLCRALGEFRVTDALPTLIKAATTERDPKEADVRRAAIEGIALAASNAADRQVFDNNQPLQEALLKAADDADPRMRTVATVALGVVGGPQNVEKLQAMLQDFNIDVRYNAAARLAALGDAAAVPILAEMLDQSEQAGVDVEKEPQMRPYKRDLININALRAVGQLAEKNHEADLGSLQTAIEKLLASDMAGEMRIEATAAQQKLAARAAK